MTSISRLLAFSLNTAGQDLFIVGSDTYHSAMDSFSASRIASSCCNTNWSKVDCTQSKRRNRLGPIMVQNLVLVYHNMHVIKQMAENKQARTQVWLPVECQAEVEPVSRPNSPLMTGDDSSNAYVYIY